MVYMFVYVIVMILIKFHSQIRTVPTVSLPLGWQVQGFLNVFRSSKSTNQSDDNDDDEDDDDEASVGCTTTHYQPHERHTNIHTTKHTSTKHTRGSV